MIAIYPLGASGRRASLPGDWLPPPMRSMVTGSRSQYRY